MYLTKITSAILFLAAAAAAAPQAPTLTEWAIHEAPGILARIEAYATTHTVNSQQSTYFDKARSAITKLDIASVPDAAECTGLFGSEDCADIFARPGSAAEGLEARAQDCKCNADQDFCSGRYYCQRWAADCNTRYANCGWFLLSACNGLCVINT